MILIQRFYIQNISVSDLDLIWQLFFPPIVLDVGKE